MIKARKHHLFSSPEDSHDSSMNDTSASPLEKEIQSYCKSASVLYDDSYPPLAWWRDHQTKFPMLALSARHHLSLIATAVSSERAFSLAGWMVSKRRCSLAPENVSNLMLVHAYLALRRQPTNAQPSSPLSTSPTHHPPHSGPPSRRRRRYQQQQPTQS